MAIEPLYPLYNQSPYAHTEGKVLLAQRAYVAAINTAAPTAAAAGVAPTGWTDLGSIDGSTATLNKSDPTLIDVRTGLYEILRGEIPTRDGDVTCTFTVVEYEPLVWAALSGDAIVGAGIYVGGRPLLQSAILLVGQNAATGSEFHHWNPKSDLVYKEVDINRFQGIQVTARFLKFTEVADVTGFFRDYKLNFYPSAP
jgi:hypothetical protein